MIGGIEDTGLVWWDGEGGRQGGEMILCGGTSGSVGGKGRRWNFPWRDLSADVTFENIMPHPL